jgi:hypothetical protein
MHPVPHNLPPTYNQPQTTPSSIIAVTTDEPTSKLQNALDALAAIGAPVSDVAFRGSFAFVAQKGYASKTVLSKTSNTDTPAKVYVTLEGNLFL